MDAIRKGNYLNIIDNDDSREEILISIGEILDIEKIYENGDYIIRTNIINRGSKYSCGEDFVCEDETEWKVLYEKIVRILGGE